MIHIFIDTFEKVTQKLQDQIGGLKIKENMEAIDKMTDVFKKMRDHLMNLEFEDLSDGEPEEEDENVKAVNELIASVEKDELENIDTNETTSTKLPAKNKPTAVKTEL